MVISASRRTDIPAFYGDWLIDGLRAGEVLVAHVRNPHRYKRVSLRRNDVDCFVFWTKNPASFISQLDIIDDMGFPYYFQFTLTPYGSDIETSLPAKTSLIDTFLALSDRLGSQRVIWRYDPIIINKQLTIDFHSHAFETLARRLSGHTRKCVISFVDLYSKVLKRNAGRLQFDDDIQKYIDVAKNMADIARHYRLPLFACAEPYDLTNIGILPNACVDGQLIEELCGRPLNLHKDKGQRSCCRCVDSVDIGSYNTCHNG